MWWTCHRAAQQGNLQRFKYAREKGCPWNEETCRLAAKGGHLECLKYAHENGCPWNDETCHRAAEGDHLDCLEYAHENGCPWNHETCHRAAEGGHLDCLEYAHENGCIWDSNTCNYAAFSGHLDCLQYAHEHGCRWDSVTYDTAACGGNLECLKYIHKHGCPRNAITSAELTFIYNKFDCFAYTLCHGCDIKKIKFNGPWDDKELYIALIIHLGWLPPNLPEPIITKAQAIVDKVLLIRRMKDAYRHAAATQIQRVWKKYMYRPGGVGMLNAKHHFQKIETTFFK